MNQLIPIPIELVCIIALSTIVPVLYGLLQMSYKLSSDIRTKVCLIWQIAILQIFLTVGMLLGILSVFFYTFLSWVFIYWVYSHYKADNSGH